MTIRHYPSRSWYPSRHSHAEVSGLKTLSLSQVRQEWEELHSRQLTKQSEESNKDKLGYEIFYFDRILWPSRETGEGDKSNSDRGRLTRSCRTDSGERGRQSGSPDTGRDTEGIGERRDRDRTGEDTGSMRDRSGVRESRGTPPRTPISGVRAGRTGRLPPRRRAMSTSSC